MKSKNGFSLVELLVAVVIVGILASIAVPKLFGHTAKAKASEVTPAAMTYIKLQQAYMIERQGVGSWKRIGYQAPGNGKTENFQYSSNITASIKAKNVAKSLGTDGRIGWQAENIVGLDDCHLGNIWTVSVISTDEETIAYKAQIVPSETSPYCIALTSDWGKLNIRPAPLPEKNPLVEDVAVAGTPDPVPDPAVDPVAPVEPSAPTVDNTVNILAQCANSSSWLQGAKNGWKNNSHQDCYNLRVQLIESGALVCADKNTHKDNCNHFVYKDPAAECEITGNNCN